MFRQSVLVVYPSTETKLPIGEPEKIVWLECCRYDGVCVPRS